jgi:hypothetical protein
MSASGATHAFSQSPLWCAYRPFIAPILQALISEGLGHRLAHLMDWKFVGDEPVQRIGGLDCIQEAQPARVAGRGMVIPQRRIGLSVDACAGGFAVVHENVNPTAGFKDSRLSFSVVE